MFFDMNEAMHRFSTNRHCLLTDLHNNKYKSCITVNFKDCFGNILNLFISSSCSSPFFVRKSAAETKVVDVIYSEKYFIQKISMGMCVRACVRSYVDSR